MSAAVTRWSAETTVHSDRKNIFAFAGEHGAYHVGTLVSGSKSKLERFEADAHLIAAAPDLLNGCNALLGLIELVTQRDDMPESIREALRTSHRIEEARAAVRKVQQ